MYREKGWWGGVKASGRTPVSGGIVEKIREAFGPSLKVL